MFKNLVICMLISTVFLFMHQEDNLRQKVEIQRQEINTLQDENKMLRQKKQEEVLPIPQEEEVSEQPSNIIAGEISAYTSCEQDVNTPSNIMANGEHVHVGAVANNLLPLGTRVRIGGNEYVVKDRTGLHDNVFDIYMETLEECNQFGRQYMDVEVL